VAGACLVAFSERDCSLAVSFYDFLEPLLPPFLYVRERRVSRKKRNTWNARRVRASPFPATRRLPATSPRVFTANAV